MPPPNSNTQLRIVQLNTGRGRETNSDLANMMLARGIQVAIIQEPYTYYNQVTGFNNMRVFVCEDKSSCIVINDRSLSAMEVPQGREDVTCVHLKGNFGEAYFVSVYCVFRREIGPYIHALRETLECTRGLPTFIGMDANATSSMWHSKGIRHGNVSARRGRQLEELFQAENLVVINERSEYSTFSGPNGKSDIDVTLANEMFHEQYTTSWEIREEYALSDHNLINVNIDRRIPLSDAPARDVIPRWSARNVNWIAYMESIQHAVSGSGHRQFGDLTLEEKVHELERIIHSANDDRMRRFTATAPRCTKWWNESLRRKRCEVRRATRRIQNARRVSAPTNDLMLHLRQIVTEYKKLIRESKKKNWQDYVASIGNENPWGPVYRFCAGKRNWSNVSALKVDGVLTKTWAESVDVLLGEFFPPASDDLAIPASDNTASEGFTREEIEHAIWSNKSGKAPGLDGITAQMCRRAWMSIPDHLYSIFEQCRTECIFPDHWKSAKVVLLLKGEDKEKTNPRSYRPISLLPVFGKTLERMMVRRLLRTVENRMSEAQFGFTRGKCTEDALNAVQSAVDEATTRYVLGVFIDFKGAFDNLGWNNILVKLEEVGCQEVGLWRSYFSGRRACVVGEAETRWTEVQRGCPQGSICGPTVWNLMLDTLLQDLESAGCKTVAYADDILLIVEASSRQQLEDQSSRWLSMVADWGESNGVEVNRSKTVCMLMKGHLSPNRPPCVRLRDSTISHVNSVKYLGVTMGVRMSYTPHLLALRDKLPNVMGKFQRILRKEWGLNRRSTEIVYNGLLVAIVMYGASAWSAALSNSTGRKLMNSCQRAVMCASLPACRTVSTEAMQVLLGAMPWDLLVIQRTAMYRRRKGMPMRRTEMITDAEIEGLSSKETRALLEDRLLDAWQTRWNQNSNGRTTFEWIPNVRYVKEHEFFQLSMQLSYLLTGHGSLNAYLWRRNLATMEDCDCGHPNEDWRHVLIECRFYADIRRLENFGMSTDGGAVTVRRALETRETFENLKEFAKAVFQRRTTRVRGIPIPQRP